MKTELEVVKPEIVPGARIRVVEHRIRNFRLHGMMENLARLLVAILEVQSNDSNASIAPSDSRKIHDQFDLIKGDLKFAMEVNDSASGSYDHEYVIAIIDQKEIQKIRNVKIKNVARDLWFLAGVVLGCDSAKMQTFTSKEDHSTINSALNVCNKSMERWIGSGSGPDDLGVYAPPFERTGTIVPDPDGDFALRLEPSKDQPDPQLDDVADTLVSDAPSK